MSLEVEEIPAPLKRHDSLFGDAEKVSHSKHHGSQVYFSCNLVYMLQQ
jgi:hypothetical protein